MEDAEKREPLQPNVHENLSVSETNSETLTRVYPYFLQQAKEFLTKGKPTVAVIFAQTAAELLSEEVLQRLVVQLHGEPVWTEIERLLPTKNIIGNEQVRTFYQRLSGDRLSNCDFWNKLDAHNIRRNGIIHQGHSCTTAEAEESVRVVENYIRHMESRVI